MRNGNRVISSIPPDDKVLRTIEVRWTDAGKIMIASHDGFTLNEIDDLRYCQIFSRERYRIKVAIYDRDLANPDALARTLCESWFDGEGDVGVWRTVELSDCDR